MKSYTKLKILIAVLAVLLIAAVYVITGIILKNRDKANPNDIAGRTVEENQVTQPDQNKDSDLNADGEVNPTDPDKQNNNVHADDDGSDEESIADEDALDENDIESQDNSSDTAGANEASLIEDEGDIIIIIPDDMDMGGF